MQRSTFTLALFALSVPVIAQQTIKCSSENGRRHFCPVDTKSGVMMVEEHSNGVCQQGSTWSYTRKGISVKDGCSADFQVGAASSSSNGSGNVYNGYANDNASGSSVGMYQEKNGSGSTGTLTATVLPAGAQLEVRLEQSVNPQEVNRGDYIPGSLVSSVMVNGRTVLPAGTPMQAKVVSAHGSPLDIRLDSTTVNSEHCRLISSSIHGATDSISGQSDDNKGNQSAGQEIGAVLEASKEGPQLPTGSVYRFRLTSLSMPMASSSNQSVQTTAANSKQ